MIIEPGFVDDPKVVALERRLGKRHGPEAVKFILRLWEHCHIGKRGGNWGPLDGDYVERVARWQGRPGELFGHLTAVLVPGRAPFIEQHAVEGQPVPSLVIHDWNTHNASLTQKWTANPNGRRGKPKSGESDGNRLASGQESTDSPPTSRTTFGTPSDRTGPDRTGPDLGAYPVPAPPPRPVAQDANPGGGFVEIPSWEEFLAASKQTPLGLPAMPEEFAAKKLALYAGRDRFPLNWRAKLGLDWRAEYREWLAKNGAEKTPAKTVSASVRAIATREELETMQADLDQLPHGEFRKAQQAKLDARWRELEALEGGK